MLKLRRFMSEAKTINQKIKDLDAKTGWLYSDEFTLDESTKKYKESAKTSKDLKTKSKFYQKILVNSGIISLWIIFRSNQ